MDHKRHNSLTQLDKLTTYHHLVPEEDAEMRWQSLQSRCGLFDGDNYRALQRLEQKQTEQEKRERVDRKRAELYYSSMSRLEENLPSTPATGQFRLRATAPSFVPNPPQIHPRVYGLQSSAFRLHDFVRQRATRSTKDDTTNQWANHQRNLADAQMLLYDFVLKPQNPVATHNREHIQPSLARSGSCIRDRSTLRATAPSFVPAAARLQDETDCESIPLIPSRQQTLASM